MWLNTIVPSSMVGVRRRTAETGHTQIVSLSLGTNRSESLRVSSSLARTSLGREVAQPAKREGTGKCVNITFRRLQTLGIWKKERTSQTSMVRSVGVTSLA